MRKLRYIRRKSRSAIWSLRLAVFSAVLFAFSTLGHHFEAIAAPDFLLLAGLVALLALVALALAVKGFVSLWRNGDKGGVRSVWGAVIALCVLAPFAATAYQAYVTPSLHDISTDLDTPPLFRGAYPRSADMNPINEDLAGRAGQQTAAYPQVTGRRYEGSPDRVLDAVQAVLKDKRWTVTGRYGMPGEQMETTLEAVAHGLLPGFTSDVAIRLTDEGDTTYVDMRSLSRYGKRDLGANARYVTEFMGALDQKVEEGNRAVGQ